MEEEDKREVLLPNWQGSGSMGITLDQNEEGVFVKQLAQNSPAAKTGVMKEGDQIVGATVYFDNMSSEDIQRLLANVGQHTVGLKLQRKGDRSPQPGMSWSHDVFSLKSPDVVLSGDDEEYRRIYTKKIKPRLKSDDSLEPEAQTRTITVTRKVTAYTVDVTGSTDSEEIDISSPEYKIKIPRHEVTEISKTTVDTGGGKTVIKIPGAGLGEEPHFVTTRSKVSIPGDSTSVHHYDNSGGISDFPDIQTDSSIRMTSRSSGVTEFPDINISGPKFQSYERKVNVKSSRFEIDPEVGLRSPNIAGASSIGISIKGLAAKASDVDNKTTSALDFTSQQPSIESSRGGLQSSVSIKGPQLDIKKPSGFKMDSYATGVQLQEPDLNLSAQQTRIGFALPTMSDYGFRAGTMDSQANLIVPTKDDDKGLQIDSSSFSGKIQIPTFTTPKFGLSETNETVKSGVNLQTSGIASESVTTRDIQLESSQLKDKVYTPSVNVRVPTSGVSSHTLETSAMDIGIAKGNLDARTPIIEFKEPEGGLKGPSVKIPSMKVELPNVSATGADLKSRDGKVTIPQLKMPKFGLSGLDAEGSINNNFSKGDVGVSGPITNINMPSMQDAQFTMQSVHLPKVPLPEVDINLKGSKLEGGIKGPKVDVKGSGVKLATPDLDIDGRIRKTAVNLEAPSVDITIPHMDVDVKDPKLKGGLNVEMKGPGLAIDMPDVDLQRGEGNFHIPKFKMPKFGVSDKQLELAGEIRGPKPDITGPNLGAPNVDIESKGDFKMPKFGMSKFGVSGPEAKCPDVDVNLPKGKLDISGPKVDVDVPDINLEGPEGKIKGPNFKMPSMNVRFPKVSKPDIDLNLKGPKLEGDLKGSKVDIETPQVVLDAPGVDIEGKVKGSEFKMPSMHLPQVSVPEIDLNLKRPKMEGDFKGPKVDSKGSKVDFNAPDLNIEGKGKFKMPKFSMPDSKAEGTDVDFNLPKGELELSGPKVDVDLPDVNIECPEGKVKGSKFKMPSMNLNFPKVSKPDFDMKLKSPKVEGDFKAPMVIKGPVVDIDAPEVDIEGKGPTFTMPKFSMPKFGISDPRVEGPDVDINLPKGKLDISGPKVDVDVPDLDLEGPEGKIKGPKFKMPSMDVSLQKVSLPDFDLNLKGPKLEGGFKGPKVDIKEPKVDIDHPDVDIDAKVKGPKFKMPSMNLPKLSKPDFDLNLKAPKVEGDLKGPKVDIKGPKIDLDAQDVDIEGKGKIKMPKFNMPKFGISGPKVECPDVDINLPKGELDVSGPKVDVNVPDIDLEGPEGTIKCPKFKMPSMDVSLPKMSMSDFDLRGPVVDIDGPDIDIDGKVKGPKFNMPSMNLPKLSKPDFDLNLKAPKVEGDLKGPKVDIKGPKMDLDAQDVDIEGKGRIKMPKFSMPKFGISGPKVECPDVDISLPIGELNVDVPDIDLEGPEGKIKGPKFKMPSMPDIDLNLKGPKPEVDLKGSKVDIKGPQIDVNDADLDIDGKAKGPSFKMPSIHLPKMSMPDFDLNLKGPNWKGDFSGPQMEGDIKVPGVDVEGPEGKMPKFKLPKFGFSGPKVEGDIDLAGPKVDLEVPDTDIEGPKGKIKGLKCNVPSLNIDLPKVSVPDIDLNLKGPNWSGGSDVSGPNLKGNLKGPKVNIELPDVDAEGPKGKFKMPKFGVSGPRVDADMDVTLPKTEMDVSGPKIDLESPEVEGKLKGPKFKMPSMNVNLPNVNVPHLNIKGPRLKGDAELSGPKVGAVDLAGNVNVKKPNIDVKTPDVNIEAPDVTLKSPGMDIEGPEGNLKMPKVKKSKFGFGIKAPKAEVKSPSLDVAIPDVEFDADIPEIDTEIKGKRGKFKMPKIHMSGPKIKGKKGGFDVSTPDVESDINLNAADADINLSGGEGDLGIKAPKTRKPLFGKIYFPDVEFDLKSPKLKGDAVIHSPKVDIKTPGLEIEGDLKTSEGNLSPRGVDIAGSDLKVKKPKFKLPTFNASGPKVPEADLHLSSPKLTGDLNAPSMDVNLNAPDLNLKAPSVSVDPSMSGISIPDVNIDMKGPKVRGGMDVSGNLGPDITGVSGKGKVPKFGIPTFGVSGSPVGGSYKVGTPDLDGNLKGPHIEMSTVDMSLPKVSNSDFEINLSGPKIKNDMDISNDLSGGKFNVGLPGVTMKGIDANVTLPKVDVSGPNLHGLDDSLHGNVSVSGPKLKLPDASSKIEIPYVNVKGKDGEVKVPKADLKGKGLKFGVEKPERDFQGVSMEGDLSGNVIGGLQFKGTEGLQISGPKVDAGQSRAGVNFSTTGGYFGEPVGIVTFPRLMMPKFTSSGPELTGREVGVDVDFPKTNVSLGKSGQADIELEESDIKIKKSKIKMPKFNFSKAKGKSDASLSDVSVTESKGELKSSKASLGSADGAGGLELGSGVGISSKEKSAKYEFSLFTSSKSRHRSSSLSEEMDSSTQSSPSGTLEAKSGEVSLEGGKKKGKHSKIKFGTFGGIGSKSKGSYEVTLSDDENVQGSGASLSSRKSRVSSSSSNDSATKAGVQLPKVELTVAKKKE